MILAIASPYETRTPVISVLYYTRLYISYKELKDCYIALIDL